MRAGLVLATCALLLVTGCGAAAVASAAESNADGAVASDLPSLDGDAAALPALGVQGGPPGEAVPAGLEGAVTTAPTVVDDRVLVGTDRGLYVVRDGEITAFASTRPVRSIAHVEGDRAVVTVEDDHFPNVLGIDLSTGAIRWTSAHERGVYSTDLGHVDRQVPAFDAVPVDDVDGDGTTDVAVTAGSAVLALDGNTGETLWTAEHRRNVWQLAVQGDRVFATTQSGSLLALDRASGERAYERSLVDPYVSDSGSIDSVPRSAWDVEPVRVDGTDRLAVTTEDGSVALLDPADGETVWRESVVEFDPDSLDNYYRGRGALAGAATIPGDSRYRSLEVTSVEAGGTTRLAVVVDVDERAAGRTYRPAVHQLHLLDAESGTVEWANEDVDMAATGSVDYAPDVRDGSLLLPRLPREGSQRVDVVDVDDGSVGEPMEIPSVPGADPFGQPAGDGYVAVEDGTVAVTSTDGDLTVVDGAGDERWRIPAVRGVETTTADLTGDGTDDYLLASRNRFPRGVQSRSLRLRAGDDGSLVWSATLGVDEVFENGAFRHVRTVETAGGSDVVAVRNPPNRGEDPRELPPSSIEVRSGEDGDRLERHVLDNADGQHVSAPEGNARFRPYSLVDLGDVTDNGNRDVLVGVNGRVFVVDVRTGDVVWERLYRETGPRDDAEQWQPVEGQQIHYRAVGGEGEHPSVVAISRRGGEIALLEPDTSGDDLTFRTVRSDTYEGRLTGQAGLRPLGDLTGDGYEELWLGIRDDDVESKVYAPAEGEMLATFVRPDRLSLVAAEAGTGDGDEPALVAFEDLGDGTRLSVTRGSETLWSQQMGRSGRVTSLSAGGTLRPAAVAGDADGDGSPELAVAESANRGGTGVRLTLHDVDSGTVVDRFHLTPWEDGREDPMPGVYVQRIPTDDGSARLGVVAARGGSVERGAGFHVVDPAGGEVAFSGPSAPARFLSLDGDVGLLGDDGSLRTVDGDSGVTLSAPDVGDDGTVDLEWAFETDGEYVTTVTVDDRPVAVTRDLTAAVRLPGGTHEIRVRSATPSGIVVHDVRTVTVEGVGSSADVALFGATGLTVVLLFAIGLVPRIAGRVRR